MVINSKALWSWIRCKRSENSIHLNMLFLQVLLNSRIRQALRDRTSHLEYISSWIVSVLKGYSRWSFSYYKPTSSPRCVTFQITLCNKKKTSYWIFLNCVAEFEAELRDKALKHTFYLFFNLICEDLKIFFLQFVFQKFLSTWSFVFPFHVMPLTHASCTKP